MTENSMETNSPRPDPAVETLKSINESEIPSRLQEMLSEVALGHAMTAWKEGTGSLANEYAGMKAEDIPDQALEKLRDAFREKMSKALG